MSTFSIGDDGDDFAQLRQGKPPAAVAKSASGNVTKLGAVPLKSPEPPKGKLLFRAMLRPDAPIAKSADPKRDVNDLQSSLASLPSLLIFLQLLPAPAFCTSSRLGCLLTFCAHEATPTAADDDLDDFLNSLADETGPAAAGGGGGGGEGANDVNVEDLDKMLG